MGRVRQNNLASTVDKVVESTRKFDVIGLHLSRKDRLREPRPHVSGGYSNREKLFRTYVLTAEAEFGITFHTSDMAPFGIVFGLGVSTGARPIFVAAGTLGEFEMQVESAGDFQKGSQPRVEAARKEP